MSTAQLFALVLPESVKLQNEKASACALIIIGVALLGIALQFFSKGYLVLHLNERVEKLSASDTPLLFYISSVALTVTGGALIVAGVSKLLSSYGRKAVLGTTQPKFTAIRRHLFWGAFNLSSGVAFLILGYCFSSGQIHRTGVGVPIIFLIAIFCTMVLCPIGAVSMATVSSLEKPTWNRSPFRWFADPLQSLFISSWLMLCVFAGTTARLLGGKKELLDLLPLYGAILGGLVTGQIIVYRVYRKRIVGGSTPNCGTAEEI